MKKLRHKVKTLCDAAVVVVVGAKGKTLDEGRCGGHRRRRHHPRRRRRGGRRRRQNAVIVVVFFDFHFRLLRKIVIFGSSNKLYWERTGFDKITGVKNETSQTLLSQFNAALKRIELQKRAISHLRAF